MDEVKKALTFAILMEGGSGVMGKAPSYMMEKWDAVNQMSEPQFLLDSANLAKFNHWYIKWHSQPSDR